MSSGKIIVGRPRIVTDVHPRGGVHCCCCTCCTCVNLQVLKTTEAKLKLAQVVVAAVCQSLILNYGMSHAQNMGPAYDSFLTTVSSCLLTSGILLACYIFSERSRGLLRSSLFETLYNVVAACLYISSSSYMSYAVYYFLRPLYIVTPFFQVYPAMTAAYVLGLVLAGLHGYDGYLAQRQFRGT
ncbi:hypothetical protein L9F63_015219 [Diploptera punctata]|uniref:MARVEL domain-containing protein n=1 Tax=Diploptera punctata TaxID=6984 RepID=A0AAD8A6R3_DIPPU|nr:hypothetical protein L9F63_015219 [Diploptera punctata]